jgi:hypothetical protein
MGMKNIEKIVLENKVLRRILGPEWEEIMGARKNYIMKTLIN